MNIEFSWSECLVAEDYISHFIEISTSELLSKETIDKIKLTITKNFENFDLDPTKPPKIVKFLFDRATDQNTTITFHANNFSQDEFKFFTQKVVQVIQEELPSLFSLAGRYTYKEIGSDIEHVFTTTLITASDMTRGFFSANQTKKRKHESTDTDPAAKEMHTAPASTAEPAALTK